jgi:hypothetical protein
MINPTIRYWIKLYKDSEPIETEDKIYLKNSLKRSTSPLIIKESIYPNGHKFEFDENVKEVIPGELSDAQRSNTVTRMFNRASQIDQQVLRKKSSTKSKPKTRK